MSRLTAASTSLRVEVADKKSKKKPAPKPSSALSACSGNLGDDTPLAPLSNASPCSGRYKLAWSLPLGYGDVGKDPKSVFSRSEFGLARKMEDEKKEVSIALDPKGRPGIQMNFPKGATERILLRMAPFGTRGVEKACLSLEMYIPDTFNWGTSAGKLGWGMWGGEPDCLGGGCPPAKQVGWSQRNVRGADFFRLYSYHLNRFPKTGFESGSLHGEYGAKVPMPKGQWLKIEQEIVMNTPSKNDGYSRVWVNGKQQGEMQNLVFRCTSDWAIRGLVINDMWGGNPSDKKNYSPQAQKMYYSDYKLYTP